MDLRDLELELASSGWKDLRPGDAAGERFDVLGSRRFGPTPWRIYVRALPVLDSAAIAHWKDVFGQLSEASKSRRLIGTCFLLCLIADEVAADAIQLLYDDDDFGYLGVFRMEGGGGKIVLASERSKQIHADVPLLPYDVRRYTIKLIEALRNAWNRGSAIEEARVVTASDRTDVPVGDASAPFSVFISYSREDENEKDQLVTHLKVLEHVGLIEIWSDDRIAPGASWEQEIRRALDRATACVILVSANSLASDFIMNTELPTILDRRRRSGVAVVPVIAKPCAWQSVGWLRELNVLPRGATPIWGETTRRPDAVLALVAEELATLVKAGGSGSPG